MIEFEQVGLRYGSGPEVLRDVSFALNAGSFSFLTGSSGSGKTSLLRLVSLAARPTRGAITLFGRRTDRLPRAELPALRRRIGIVFQDFRLLGHLSSLDNVALPLRVAGLPERRVRAHARELLEWVGLGDCLDAHPPSLSGGQQQRIAVARAVIGHPDLLIADEPTGNLDEVLAIRLLRLFEELNRLGTTVVIATHNEALIAASGYRRFHLADGRLAVPPPLPQQTALPF